MTRPSDIRPTPLVLAGLALLLVAAAALAWTGLRALQQARTRLALTEAMARAGAAPVAPLLPPGQAYSGDRAAAQTAMLAAIHAAAAERHLLLESAVPLPADRHKPAELAVAISVSGPEADILHFAHRLEAGRPIIRFRPWRLIRTGPAETAIRLEARAHAYRVAR